MKNLLPRVRRYRRKLAGWGLELALGTACASGVLPATGCTAAANGSAKMISAFQDLALPGDPTLGGWVADYDTAQAQVRETGRELLIFYKDTRLGVDDDTWRSLNSRELKPILRPYVRCKLFRPYEPDRRFVAQYGVERAPALIIVHSDGTYHAQVGSMSTARISEFLAQSAAPGSWPTLNPHIPRRVEYGWHRSFESAQAAAEESHAPILLVYHRWLTRDWARLEKLLSAREVYTRFGDLVHCRLGGFWPWTKACVTQYGALRLPALVVVHRDATVDVLELPTSTEAVVRFADEAISHQPGRVGSAHHTQP